MKVISDIWHPNIEKNGDVCISILHEPGNLIKPKKYLKYCVNHIFSPILIPYFMLYLGDDRWGYEKASERWLPVHTVETILVSVISMLADPNDEYVKIRFFKLVTCLVKI